MPDTGGWVVRERGSNLRLGTSEVPFVALFPQNGPPGGWVLVGVDVSGASRLLASVSGGTASFVGVDSTWSRFLLSADAIKPASGGSAGDGLGAPGLFSVDLAGNVTRLLGLPAALTTLSGWTGADGATYLQYDALGSPVSWPFTAPRSIGVVRDGTFTEVVTADGGSGTRLFAVSPVNWKGAWILKRDAGPTVLMSHGLSQGLVTHWSDVTRSEVEALHVALSGRRLLVQVHRPRQTPERRFVDPALAFWEVGQPAPKQYDELFLNEQSSKGFVHLDVDEVAFGAPFVFDSGTSPIYVLGGGPTAGAGGGADVLQEWGVVRGALRQRLVIPAAARAAGAFASTWRTDLILRNPGDTPLSLAVQLLPNAQTTDGAPSADVLLAPNEIRTVPDVLSSLLGLERGSGALLLVPAEGRSVDATSRTYAVSENGTFGMGVGAVDLFASASPNFPVTFAAALLGPDFRTNVVLTDTSGRGSKLELAVAPASADETVALLNLDAPARGQRQLSGLAGAAGLPPGSRGSVQLGPTKGEVVAGLIAIDNATNDPTWWAPDLPAVVPRTIPALVHTGGAGGAEWRSDLYLFNPTGETQTVFLSARSWTSPADVRSVSFTLLPEESKVVRDALLAAFGMTGVARVTFQSGASPTTNEGVRATSRTWTASSGGGTYGHPVPPLNSFQAVAAGETLEILGPVAAPGSRTNLALVDLLDPGNATNSLSIRVEILDAAGRTADSFTTPVAPGGGSQLNDLFNARGLPADLGPVLIRVTPSGGMVAAYATTIDNGTNDPTYFQAGLTASE